MGNIRKSIKFIGDSIQCAWRLPFANNKLRQLINKPLQSTTKKRTYSFEDGSLVEIQSFRESSTITITAGGSTYIFAGSNEDDITETFELISKDQVKISTNKPFTAPFPTLSRLPPHDDIFLNLKIPRFDWFTEDGKFIVMGGVGSRYSSGYIDHSHKRYEDAHLKDLIPEVLYPNGRVSVKGVVGSECISASLFQGHVIGVTSQGLLRTWSITDPSSITEINLPLPAWHDDPFTIDFTDGSTVSVYHGTGSGTSGTQWNFSKNGETIVGGITRFMKGADFGLVDDEVTTFFARVDLNPVVDNTGILTVTPVLIQGTINFFDVFIDWDYTLNEPVYSSLRNRTWGASGGDNGYTMTTLYNHIDSGVVLSEVIVKGVNSTPSSLIGTPNFQITLNGIDLRYSTLSYNASSNKYLDGFAPLANYILHTSNPLGVAVNHDSLVGINIEETDELTKVVELALTGDPYGGGLDIYFHRTTRTNLNSYDINFSHSSGVHCKVDTFKQTYKIGSMTAYHSPAGTTPSGKPIQIFDHGIDFLEIDGVPNTHETLYSKLGYTKSITPGSHLYTQQTYCLYNLFTE